MMLYRSILRPLLFRLPPETAHELALHSLAMMLGTRWARHAAASRYMRSPFGELRRFSLLFKNPVGIAAGFDKNGAAAQALCALGFGFVEVGSVTNQPQPGNPRPRLFRLPQDQALINRAGFNNEGAARIAERLRQHPTDCVLGINIGKSRAVPLEEAAEDYLACFDKIYDVADYVVVNVSSPNTPNLRKLQSAEALSSLLYALQKRNRELAEKRAGREAVPMLVKIAPDLISVEIEEIVRVAQETKIAGIIATNTTTERKGLRTPKRNIESFGEGGLSGAPLRSRSTEVVAALYRMTRGSMPIIGVGGIFTAEDAWEKICAGACLVQLYTGFIYQGPRVAREINEGLARILEREGLRSLDEAVGSRAKEFSEGMSHD
ncbi:MAG: dihydroorotate dehydrogenase (quinone) [Acidobacteria bacterium 13_1_20CM_3_53_8]|nr:MAG: dihydroorotate dehydrogenase (quinone) [Acidobacteria bacterium 13_1_20CM_3_53_8]